MKTILFLSVACWLLPVRGPAQSTVPWSTVSTGFAISTSSTSMVKCVVGQGWSGRMEGASSIIESGFLADTLFRGVVVSVAEQAGVPTEFSLFQNYPNPFNPTTVIAYDLPRESQVLLMIFNALGQNVATLVSSGQRPGHYSVHFDGRRLASGVYLCRLQAGDFVQTRKLLLLK
jgi:hypothetical protein